MARIELDAEDLNALLEFIKTHKSYSELNKVKNFRFSEDGNLEFEQNFMFSTTVQLALSPDDTGKFLLIDIIRLAENYLGNKALEKFIPLITEIIVKKTHGVFTKHLNSQLVLDLSKLLPVPMILKKCSISKQFLSIDIAVQKS